MKERTPFLKFLFCSKSVKRKLMENCKNELIAMVEWFRYGLVCCFSVSVEECLPVKSVSAFSCINKNNHKKFICFLKGFD